MKLLKKIKLNYNLKLLNDLVINNKYDEANKLITDIKNKDKLDLFLLLKNSQNLMANLPSDFYKRKIIWTVSYDSLELTYINQFLNYYLLKNLNFSFFIKNFATSLNDLFVNLGIDNQVNEIKFEDFLTYSNLYQNLLLYNFDRDFLFMNTCNSFFQTNKKNFFIHPNITFCYIYVIRDPKELLIRYKSKFNSPEASYDELFNFSNQPYLSEEQENMKFKVFENRTNYNINYNSWTDENVISTYKGKIISYEKLLDDTQNVLLEILYHLKQYGMDVGINLDDINNFVSTNKIDGKNYGDLSNNDKKFLNKNLDKIIFPVKI